MKKSKKECIRELEAENKALKSLNDILDDIIKQIREKLAENHVILKYIPPEGPEFVLESGEKVYGMATGRLKFELDFSEHDAEVLERNKNDFRTV